MSTLALASVLFMAQSWTDLDNSGSGPGISNTTGTSLYPSLALDSQGRPWVAWDDYTTNEEILLRYWNGSAWVGLGGSETGGGVSNTPGNSASPSLALDSSDRPVIAWGDSLGIYVRHWNGSNWVPYGSSDTGYGIATTGPSNFQPKLVLDASDRPVVAWLFAGPTIGSNPPPPYQIYVKRWSGSSWDELNNSGSGVGISNATGNATSPSLALDSAGNPVVAWGNINPAPTGKCQIFVKRWDGANWVPYGTSATTLQGMSGTGSHGDFPAIVLDSTDMPIVAWHEYDLSANGYGEIYVRRWNGSTWAALGTSATGEGISLSGGAGARYASLVLDASGNPAIAWTNGPITLTDEIFYKRWDGVSWSGVAGSATTGGISHTAGSSGFASLALNAAGDPVIAWSEGGLYPNPSEIYVRALTPPGTPTGGGGGGGGCGLSGLETLGVVLLLRARRRRSYLGL